jgi:heme/copper-type cytochrome/quinol oxidase subunit 3
LAGVSEHHLEEHEEWGGIGFWMMMATGVSALISLFAAYLKMKARNWAKGITVLLTLATLAILAVAANYGGQIRHSEIRGEEIKNTEVEKEKDDD